MISEYFKNGSLTNVLRLSINSLVLSLLLAILDITTYTATGGSNSDSSCGAR